MRMVSIFKSQTSYIMEGNSGKLLATVSDFCVCITDGKLVMDRCCAEANYNLLNLVCSVDP